MRAGVFEGPIVSQFTQEGADGDDDKAKPKTPDETTEDDDDLMTQEGREGDDEEDEDGYDPTDFESVDLKISHRLDVRVEEDDDLMMIDSK